MREKKENRTEFEKFKEKDAKAWSKHLIKENKKFEKKYVNLYDELYRRFQIEFKHIQNLEDKCDFFARVNGRDNRSKSQYEY